MEFWFQAWKCPFYAPLRFQTHNEIMIAVRPAAAAVIWHVYHSIKTPNTLKITFDSYSKYIKYNIQKCFLSLMKKSLMYLYIQYTYRACMYCKWQFIHGIELNLCSKSIQHFWWAIKLVNCIDTDLFHLYYKCTLLQMFTHLAGLKCKMFQRVGMREGGKPLPLAFQRPILMIWRPCDLNLVMISSLASISLKLGCPFFQPFYEMKLKTSNFKILAFCSQWRHHDQIQITRSSYH